MALEPKTLAFVEAAQRAAKPRHLMPPGEAREAFSKVCAVLGPGAEPSRCERRALAVAGGEIELRILVPQEAPRGVIVYFHGGGWVIGSNDEFEPMCRDLAAAANCAVLMACYRKAPEHPYPTPLNDAWAAFDWVAANLVQLFGKELPVLVGGDSAGGNLAAGVALRERQRGSARIQGQLLIYPVTDTNFETSTYLAPEMQLLLPAEGMKAYWNHYLPDIARRQEPEAAPLQVEDLTGLPPTIILTAEYDVLRDEGEAYARRLRDAGVPVALRRFEGQIHGFAMMVDLLPGSAEAIDYAAHEIRMLLPS